MSGTKRLWVFCDATDGAAYEVWSMWIFLMHRLDSFDDFYYTITRSLIISIPILFYDNNSKVKYYRRSSLNTEFLNFDETAIS